MSFQCCSSAIVAVLHCICSVAIPSSPTQHALCEKCWELSCKPLKDSEFSTLSQNNGKTLLQEFNTVLVKKLSDCFPVTKVLSNVRHTRFRLNDVAFSDSSFQMLLERSTILIFYLRHQISQVNPALKNLCPSRWLREKNPKCFMLLLNKLNMPEEFHYIFKVRIYPWCR